jgi:uncharacterized membrane protein
MKWLNSFRQQNKLLSEQPFKWPEMTPQDWLMEAISVVGLIFMFAFIIYYYPKLPRVIPVHFDEYGTPRENGSRDNIWIIPSMTLLIHMILPFRERISPILRSPKFLKRVYTQTQFNARVRLFRYTKMIMTWGLFYISASTVRLSLHTGLGVAAWFPWVFVTAIFVPTVYYWFIVK